MRKFLFILSVLCVGFLSSCSTTSSVVASYGNITAFSSSGDTIKYWKNVCIATTTSYNHTDVLKANGINFTDNETGQMVFINNAVPVIIEYTTEIETYNTGAGLVSFNIDKNTDLSKYSTKELRAIQSNIAQAYYIKYKELKSLKKGTPEYNTKFAEMENLKTQFYILKAKLGNYSGTL